MSLRLEIIDAGSDASNEGRDECSIPGTSPLVSSASTAVALLQLEFRVGLSDVGNEGIVERGPALSLTIAAPIAAVAAPPGQEIGDPGGDEGIRGRDKLELLGNIGVGDTKSAIVLTSDDADCAWWCGLWANVGGPVAMICRVTGTAESAMAGESAGENARDGGRWALLLAADERNPGGTLDLQISGGSDVRMPLCQRTARGALGTVQAGLSDSFQGIVLEIDQGEYFENV